VSTSHDRTAIVWDLLSGKKLHELSGHADHVIAAAYSPDGKTIATGSKDHKIKLWGSDTGKLLDMQIQGQHLLGILDLAFSNDGRLLVSGGKDKRVKIWNALTGEQIAILSGHTDVVNAVAISGHYLATGADDGIRLWDLQSYGRVAAFSGRDHGAQSLAFSSDGLYLAAGGRDGVVRVYTMQVKELVELAKNRVRRGWTDNECKQFLRGKPCPRSIYSILDEAHRKFEQFDFDSGERLLREAKGGRDSDSEMVNAEIDTRLGTAFLWAASNVVEEPEIWAEVTKDKDPWDVSFMFLEEAKQRSPDLMFDPQSRLSDLIAYGEVKLAGSEARAGKLNEAINRFNRGRALGWTLPDKAEVVASQLYALGVFSDAWDALHGPKLRGLSTDEAESQVKRLKDAVNLYPEIGPAHRLLAEFYKNQRDIVSAEKHYLEAAKIESSAEPLILLAIAMVEHDPKKATQYANLALERDRDSDRAWLTLGLAENALKNWKNAAYAFDQVSPSSSFFTMAANASASVYFEYLGDDQAAYQRVTRAAMHAPNDLSILANYAEFLLSSGRNDQAKVAAARALENPDAKKPGNAYIRAAMSFVLFEAELLSGDRQGAIIMLNEIEDHVKAAAAETEAKVSDGEWAYKGIRRSLEQRGKTESPEQRSALRVLDFVESNGKSGSIGDMKQLLSSEQPSG
jgi:Tfp pilus assembly protein PilF